MSTSCAPVPPGRKDQRVTLKRHTGEQISDCAQECWSGKGLKKGNGEDGGWKELALTVVPSIIVLDASNTVISEV